ncbi:MAG: type IV pilus secretin PilQ [Methylococcaceae bacterium]
MNIKYGGIMLNKMGRTLYAYIGLGLFLSLFQILPVSASELAISGIDIASLAGDKLQIQLEMNGAAVTPKVFQTDNPARIALDFPGVKNALGKKMYPINQGTATSIYVAEATDRVRVVVNLIESTPFETKIVGNKVFLTLTRANSMAPATFKPAPQRTAPVATQSTNTAIAALMPQQTISGFDFKRGDKGEGRILVSLANPNTIVNTKEEGGNVVISFMNTRLPANLAKRLDVSEFATPVKFIDTTSSSQGTKITVSTQNQLYDYSLIQSEGLLTVEFRPLSNEEKDALDRTRVKYSGERLSLNFQEIEIRSVIAILAEFTGQNVVAGDDVTGTITLKLDDVPWDEALDFVMMTKELGKFETGNVTLISPLDKIKDYKKKQQETEKVVEQLDPLVTEYIKVNYAKAEDFRNLLNGLDASTVGSCVKVTAKDVSSSSSNQNNQNQNQNNQNQNQNQNQMQNQQQNQGPDGERIERFTLLSTRGSAVVDSRTNTLIVRETAKRLEEIKKLIHKLDIPVRQVMIESRIVIATNSFAKELGVRFGVAGKNTTSTSTGVGGGTQSGGSITAAKNALVTTTNDNVQNSGLNDALVDLATSGNPYGALGMTLARGADYVLNLELSALQDEGRGELVSNPRVMTSDRCLATIQQGTQVPYITLSQNGTQTTFVDAVLQLGVLPQITPEGSVIMGLYITKNTLGEVVTDAGDRLIDKREVRTSVQVEDGETVVLGGVFEGEQNNSANKVPFFSDLPGIGFLFKKTFNQDDKRELLIFVTPKIMKDETAIN